MRQRSPGHLFIAISLSGHGISELQLHISFHLSLYERVKWEQGYASSFIGEMGFLDPVVGFSLPRMGFLDPVKNTVGNEIWQNRALGLQEITFFLL